MQTTRANAQRLHRLLEQMRQNRKGSPVLERLRALNLSWSHIHALHLLAGEQPLAMKELAKSLDMAPPSVTALTRRLVEQGLVRRQPHPHDSRVNLLSLTEAGRCLLRDLYEDQLQAMENLLAGLSQEEQRQFLDLLERAVRAMQAG